MGHKLAIGILLALLLITGMSALVMGGTSTFDLLGMVLTAFRMTAWVIGVSAYYPLMVAMGEDDLEKDWQRINDGNVAVAVFRGLEFAVVGITLALLLSQI